MKPLTNKAPAGAVARAKEEINSKVKAVTQDRKNLNLMLDLLENLESNNASSSSSKENHARVTTSLRGLVDITKHLILQGDLDDREEEGEEESAKVLLKWTRDRLDGLWGKLLEFLGGPDEGSLSELALVSAFKIIRAFQQRRSERSSSTDLDHWSGEEVKRLRSLLPVLCSSNRCCHKKIRRFQEYVDYWDVKHYVIQGLAKIAKARSKKTKKGEEEEGKKDEDDGKTSTARRSQLLRSNLMSMLEILRFSDPSSDKKKEAAATLLTGFQFSYECTRKSFSELWEGFLAMGSLGDPQLYRRALVLINDQVLSHLTRPLLLTDFLLDSYGVGGAVSVLALGGVFALMQKHNLEYPDFYTKLYALFQPDVLAAKYRARFFYLADIFLTSTHLPEYLVAAFAKRLSRLALTAPAESLLMVFPFIGNLLLRHPGLLRMIRGGEEDLADDPYDASESDPAKCRAAESCLWEVQTLQSHALPQVAQAAKFISKKLPEMEWDLSEVLELGMEDMMRTEARKKVFVNVPVNFQRPEELKFQKNDLTAKFFDSA